MRYTHFLVWVLLCLTGFACTPEWTAEEKLKFHESCKSGAIRQGFRKPDAYCDCMLGKMMNKFPNPDEVEDLDAATLQEMAQTCYDSIKGTTVIWPEQAQKVFIDNCTKHAQETGIKNPGYYCSCVLGRVQADYPSAEEMAALNTEKMQEIGKACETASQNQ